MLAEEGELLGAFQRSLPGTWTRRTGGPSLRIAHGTVYLALRLATSDALLPCTPSQIVNRYVRPLLRALTKVGKPASYFGRDWVSIAKTPVAWVGFAHHSETGEALFEAFVGVDTPFSEPRDSFLGKVPVALSQLLGRPIDAGALAADIAEAYMAEYGKYLTVLGEGELSQEREGASVPRLSAWSSVVSDAIGDVCATRDSGGIVRIGGDLMASEDAVARFEDGLSKLGEQANADAIVELARHVFLDPKVALSGARPESIAFVATQAMKG